MALMFTTQTGISFCKKGAYTGYVSIYLKKYNVTLMCLSIGTPKNNKFSICKNNKFFICPKRKISAEYSLIVICSNIETSKNQIITFGTNGKLMFLGVPILRHFRVIQRRGDALMLMCR